MYKGIAGVEHNSPEGTSVAEEFARSNAGHDHDTQPPHDSADFHILVHTSSGGLEDMVSRNILAALLCATLINIIAIGLTGNPLGVIQNAASHSNKCPFPLLDVLFIYRFFVMFFYLIFFLSIYHFCFITFSCVFKHFFRLEEAQNQLHF